MCPYFLTRYAKIALALFFIAAVCGCEKKQVWPSAVPAQLLCDFERPKLWGISPEHGFKISLDRSFSTQGKFSLKVVYPKSDTPSINTRKLASDWSRFQYLTFDVYNPQKYILPFVVRIDDKARKRENVEYPLAPGMNHVKIPLAALKDKIDISKIGFVVLFLDGPKKRATLYFDNMGLALRKRAVSTNIARPRLLFNKEELPRLRERFNTTQLGPKNLLLDHAESKNDYYTWAFLYQMLGDERCAQRALDNMTQVLKGDKADLEELALAYDWCHDVFDDDLRDRVIAAIERLALDMMKQNRSFRSFHNTMYSRSTAIAAAGYALEGDSDLAQKFIEFAAEQYKDAMAMFNNVFVDGEWPESLDYNRHIAFPLVKYFEMVRTATGRDLYKECDWLYKNAYFVMYTTQPDDTFYRFADNDFPTITDWERRFLARVASYYKDPYVQWYVNHKTEPHTYASRPIYDVLWYEMDLPEKPLQELPKAKYFKGIGVVIARSGWDKEDTWLSFKCGDYFGDHAHLDNNSFTLYKFGNLAIDSGLYGDDFGSSHWVNYYSRTIAHNTMLVYDPNEKFDGYEMEPLSNDGGQRIMLWERGERVVPENYAQPDPSLPWTWVRSKELWETGEIKAFKLSDDYCYMAGDATASYISKKLGKYIRHILYIFPDYFLVMDEVVSTQPVFKKKWLLHTVNEPQIRQDEVTATEEYGKLYLKTVYPSSVLIGKAGGPGQEFLVNGENYPHNDQIYKGNIPGNWRIEIEPQSPKKEDFFLNFLCVSRLDGENIPKVEKIGSDDAPGVILRLPTQTWAIVFNRAVAGTIKYVLTGDGKIKNLIMNLKAGSDYEVKVNGVSINKFKTDKQGILEFEAQAAGQTSVEIRDTSH